MSIESDDKRFVLPFWAGRHFWRTVAGTERVISAELPALAVRPDEPRLSANYYGMHLGPERRLHDQGRHAFEKIQSEFSFGSWDFWGKQRDWLDALFRTFFQKGGKYPGWWSMVSARRPAHLRFEQQSGITIVQSKSRIYELYRATELAKGRKIDFGVLRIPTTGMYMASKPGSKLRDNQMLMTIIPRELAALPYQVYEPYDEHWSCLGNEEEDRKRLLAGQIPAVPETSYSKSAIRIRQTRMLNLVKVSGAELFYDILAVELDPESAEVLTIRQVRMPLAGAVLSLSPVERLGLVRAANRLSG